jgi:hypothetical protein
MYYFFLHYYVEHNESHNIGLDPHFQFKEKMTKSKSHQISGGMKNQIAIRI